jgi:hypothetical protein
MLIPVAALLTIANMAERPPENKGIDCLTQHENRIYAYVSSSSFSEHNAYFSVDSGYTWVTESIEWQGDFVPIDETEISDVSTPDLRFRFVNPSIIERSTDGGVTWQEEFQIEPFGEVEEIILRKTP